jgi:hypothetical protein
MPQIPINDQVFPNLHTASGNTKIEWDFGLMYAIQITASFIRIDADQIQWYDYGRFHASTLWTPLVCETTRNAFCSIVEEKTPFSVLVFPSGTVDMPVDTAKLELPREFHQFFENIGGLQCKSKTANRLLSYTDNRYEISMCDLVDRNLEVVFIPGKSILYIRQHKVDVFVIVLLSLLSLYLFVKTCEHFIQLSHGKRTGFTHGSVTVPFLVALSVSIKLIVAESVLIIAEETTLQQILCVYTLFHTSIAIHAQRKAPCVKFENKDFSNDRGGTAIGTLIAAQVLLSLELNQTIDSPFLSIYVSLFGLRNFLKFLNLLRLHYHSQTLTTFRKVKKTLETIADTCVFICLIVIGMKVSTDSGDDSASAVGSVMFISMLSGTLAHSITTLYVPTAPS